MTLKLLERRLNNNFEPYKGEDGQIFTIVVRTDVMGSVRIKCALLSKLEPYCAPDPEADDWMRKAESCRLY
jgi:hypothetical protein